MAPTRLLWICGILYIYAGTAVVCLPVPDDEETNSFTEPQDEKPDLYAEVSEEHEKKVSPEAQLSEKPKISGEESTIEMGVGPATSSLKDSSGGFPNIPFPTLPNMPGVPQLPGLGQGGASVGSPSLTSGLFSFMTIPMPSLGNLPSMPNPFANLGSSNPFANLGTSNPFAGFGSGS